MYQPTARPEAVPAAPAANRLYPVSDAAAVAAISKVPPPVCCKARIVPAAEAGVTVPRTLPKLEAGRLSGAAAVETAVLLPATTGTLRIIPVPRAAVDVGTLTTSMVPVVLLCSIGDSVKLPLLSATVALTTTPPRSAKT